MAHATTNHLETDVPTSLADVLTLHEAAEYLRVPVEAIVELVYGQGLPGRRIGADWRFLRTAVEDWLRVPDQGDFWSTHFGALKGDPYLEQILERVDDERRQAI